ncbi:hypothetical protein [Stenotrophomonas sp.]|uniref:hypothetical protein n=1 Tax=Stenotrophomonas sp. TaxID=69392 RepID=UPI002FCA67FC
MISALHPLSGPGKPLSVEPPDLRETEGLQRSGLARLRDARNPLLSLESRFDLAYNAAHALCLSALRQCGFRPAQRYIVFQVLPHTLGLGPEVWRVLDKCHHQRNIAEYEGHLEVGERLVLDLIAACDRVRVSLGLEG